MLLIGPIDTLSSTMPDTDHIVMNLREKLAALYFRSATHYLTILPFI